MGDASTTHAAGALVRIVAEPEIIVDGVTVVDADWTCGQVAEAIHYAPSKATDRVAWFHGLVERARQLFDSESRMKFKEAIANTEPSRGVREALERINKACGTTSPEATIEVLQRWGEERERMSRRLSQQKAVVDECLAKHRAACDDAAALRAKLADAEAALERERANVKILQETFKMAMEKR